MKTSLWLNVDPLTEKMPNYGPYIYTFNNPIRFTDPTGMIAEPPVGLDAEDGAIHNDGSGSWKYNKATTTWVGQKNKNGERSKDIGNTIELDNVNIKGYKSNYVPSREYGPDKDPVHAAMAAGVVILPVLVVEGALAAGGAYIYSEGAAALSQITWGSAGINMASNATAQYLANGRSFGDINMVSTASSIVPGIGPAAFGETFSYTANKGFKTPDSFDKWVVQAGAAILSNRYGKATDNYLSGSGFGEAMIREYFKGIVAVGANSAPSLVSEKK